MNERERYGHTAVPEERTIFGYESATTRLIQHDTETCALIQDLLPLYTEGEVSATSRDVIMQHLPHCERCAGFLAGAQSVHAQLRRERVDVARVMISDQPERQAIQTSQWLARAALAVALTPIALIAMGELWSSLGGFGRPTSAMVALVGFATLFLTLARRRRLSARSIITLGAASFAGSIGLVSLLSRDSRAFEAPYFFSAVALVIGSLAAVWAALGRETASESLSQRGDPR